MQNEVNISKLSYKEKIKLAEDEYTSKYVLTELSNEKEKRILIAIAFNQNASFEAIEKIIKYEDSILKEKLKKDPNAKSEILDTILMVHDLYLHLTIIQNNDISVETLQYLATYGTVTVKRAVARHKNASANILSILSKTNDRALKRYLMENPNTPKKVIIKFIFDEDFLIRDKAKEVIKKK